MKLASGTAHPAAHVRVCDTPGRTGWRSEAVQLRRAADERIGMRRRFRHRGGHAGGRVLTAVLAQVGEAEECRDRQRDDRERGRTAHAGRRESRHSDRNRSFLPDCCVHDAVTSCRRLSDRKLTTCRRTRAEGAAHRAQTCGVFLVQGVRGAARQTRTPSKTVKSQTHHLPPPCPAPPSSAGAPHDAAALAVRSCRDRAQPLRIHPRRVSPLSRPARRKAAPHSR